MVSVDLSLVFQLFLLILFIITMNFLLYKPFLRIMSERRAMIDTMQQEIESAKAEADRLRTEFSAELRTTSEAGRTKIAGIMQQSESESRLQITETVHSCESELTSHRKVIETELEVEKRRTEQSISELTQLIRKKLIPCIVLCFIFSGTLMYASASGTQAENTPVHESEHSGGISEIARTVDFVLMVGLLAFLLRKPIRTALEGRISSIRQSIDSTQSQKAEVLAASEGMHEQFRQLPRERTRIEHETQTQIDQIIESSRRATMERKEKLHQECQRQLLSQTKSAGKDLRQYVAQSAIDRVRSELEKGVDDSSDRAIVSDCIEQMRLFFGEKGGKIHA